MKEKFMKFISLSLMAVVLTGCLDTTSSDSLDSPPVAEVLAEENARHEGTVFGASGISALAYIGTTVVSTNPGRVDVVYEPTWTDDFEINMAPHRICAFRNSTALKSVQRPHPDAQNYPTARVL